ncbi:amidohydrolase family protein [Glycomyces buryatensis]|uniref:Amidohydrolase n=1 Tax=Glycomyces buryatensis TaxID=2570927 RepID=A0A4S8PXL8_9ACTN|nr:amidohydrolase family protein [Glycomyces buryatensis]THV36427.1 amidohydrolase [Glycomyces buryatensis]
MIIDAHRHVWDTRVLRYPWLDSEPSLPRTHLPADAADAKVTGAVFVQADAADGAAEAAWVQGLAASWPQLSGIVAHAPIEDADALVPRLDELSALPLHVGVRRLLQDEPPGFIESEAVLGGLAELARRGLPFDACIRYGQLPELTRAVAAVPGLRVVLDHLGKPPVAAGIASPEGREWVRMLRDFAAVPGTLAKLSGLAPEADPGRPLREQVAPFLSNALVVFGPDRLMVGSDWPVSAATPHQTGFGEWFELVSDVLRLAPDDAERVLSATAERHYGLKQR